MGKKRKSRNKISKTDAIKAELKKSSTSSPKAIAEALKAKGIEVEPGYVSTIKTSLKKQGLVASKPRNGPNASDAFSEATLLDAKALIEAAGSPEKAKRALDVVTKLQ